MENALKTEWLCCRVCLGSEKPYNIEQYNLLDIFLHLAGSEISETPIYLCYICATLLSKYAAFRSRCKESEKLLNTARENNMIPDVYCQYTKSDTHITEYPDQTELKIAEVIVECKNAMSSNNDILNASVKTEEDLLDEDVEVKIENDYVDSLEILHDNLEDNDMEYENEIIDTKPNKVRKTKYNDKNGFSENDLEEKSDKNDNFPVKFKQKGKYFETKENIANFERVYDVDIKILSKEQQMQDVREKDAFNYPYRCNDCYKGFMDGGNLVKHNLSLHDPSRGNSVCDVCKSRYKDKRDLNRHMKTHRLKFTCRQCKYVCRNTSNAVEHFKMHAGQLYKCENCDKSYEKQSTYLTHMRLRHPSQLVWCELCGESFISDFGLNGHKKLAHKDLKFHPDTKCSACDSQFMNTEALRRHQESNPCTTVASCVHCGVSFTTRLMLKDHLLETHRPRSSKGHYPCVKCNKTFPKQNLYSAHYRRVHADPATVTRKSIMCELCGKAVANKCELRYHQRTHTGEKPFKCPQCPKSFIKAALMKNHMRVHSSDRPFACKLCPKTFKGPAALNGHQYVHTGMKPPARRKRRPQFVTETERIN